MAADQRQGAEGGREGGGRKARVVVGRGELHSSGVQAAKEGGGSREVENLIGSDHCPGLGTLPMYRFRAPGL